MILKNFFQTILLTLISSSVLYAQTEQKLKIKSATIFLKGAELHNTAKVKLKEGVNELVFTNVATNINIKSLNVGADNGAIVQSAVFKKDYLNKSGLSPKAQLIEDSIKLVHNNYELVTNRINTVNDQLSFFEDNSKIKGNEKNLTVEELSKMLDFYDKKLNQLYDKRSALTKKQDSIGKYISKLRSQLNEENNKSQNHIGQIIVKLQSKRATTANIKISYVTNNAGWIPSYDVRVDKVNAPITLAYKGHVYQNSGISWEKVKLKLSAGNPSKGAEAPILKPWQLAFYRPKKITYSNMPTRNTSSLVSAAPGVLSSADGGSVNIGGARGDGTLYIIDGVQVYGSKGINLSQSAIDQQEVQMSGTSARYGNSTNRGYTNNYNESYNPSSSIEKYVHVKDAGVATTFDIELPYTIPSDNKKVNVTIKSEALPAKYRYYAVPKADEDVFLQALVTGWEDLNLMPAQTNVFYEGTYIGEGYIDTRSIKDTLSISLGRDKKIVIKRERDKTLRSDKSITNSSKELFAYTINIRNTRKENIELVLKDQIPISYNKAINVNDIEYGDASYNKDTGGLLWKLQIAPNETIDKKLKFTVKYPKNRQINL